MNKSHLQKVIAFFGIFAFLTACGGGNSSSSSKSNNNETPSPTPATLTYKFSSDTESWQGDFADYPVGEETFYELSFEHDHLPSPLNESDGALKVSGNNYSDDLFMFIKRQVSGLEANTRYKVTFKIEFATNVADNMFGVGGSPGEGVILKAGATQVEPSKILDNTNNYYQMNIDKANQSQGGKDMVIVGDFSNDTDQNVYTLKTVTNSTPFIIQTNNQGELWLIVGTESAFEATTTIYYNTIEVTLE